jgi:hypothetical protein
LNFFGSVGFRTMMRVRYGAVVAGLIDHMPSWVRGPTLVYDVAVPDAKYSFSEYPAFGRSTLMPEISEMPLPPVIGPLNVAAGPGGAGARVVGVATAGRVDEEFDAVDDFADEEHPVSPANAATTTQTMTEFPAGIRGSLADHSRSTPS